MERPWFQFYEEGIPHTLTYPPDLLHQLLETSAKKYATRTAVKFVVKYLAGGKIAISGSLTYRQLNDYADRFATGLTQTGVKKGDRVAIMLPNSPQQMIAFFGALKVGAVVVNTNPLYVSREMKEQFNDAGAETLVLLNLFYPRLREIQDDTKLKNIIVSNIEDFLPFPWNRLVVATQKKHGEYVEVKPEHNIYHFKRWLEKYPPTPPKVEISQEDVCLFQYTGGTTGTPKAAMLTHRNLVVNIIQISHWLKDLQKGQEVMMGAIPFFHVYGMTVCMGLGIYIGAKVIALPSPRPIDFPMTAIQAEKASLFPGVPAMYIGIINHPDVKQYDLRSVKACISGAAPLPMEVQETFEKITGGRLVEGYGLTEAAPVTHVNPIYGKKKSGSIGLPLPDVDAKIVDMENRSDLGIDKDGELAVKGPQVMKGYWQKPEDTKDCITGDGWLLTGDIAKMDKDGYFYIVDRKKDMIDASGFKVLPREVEEILFKHPKIADAVVAGVPDRYRGETVKGYIVLRPNETLSEQEIIEFCKLYLAPFKVPKQIEFRTELPKTMVGKVLRRVLVEEEKKKLAEKK